MNIRRLLCVGMCLTFLLCLTAERTVRSRLLVKSLTCDQWVDSVMAKMTLKQKIGQLFIHTVAPITQKKNVENLRQAIADYGIGGLLFSGGDVGKQVELTNMAQQWSNIPLLITFDGEYGLAMRLKGTPEFPKNRVLGCIQNDSLIYRYGREVARELREIGVHINFSPVADVDNNPANPVINVRSFGSNPYNVARKVVAYVHGLEDGGVMSVCKHFPGHGDTDVDSHKALPVLPFNRTRLDSVELYPFREAIKAGVGGVMVGHMKVPKLSDKPASVSEELISQILKRDLGFMGMTITDALEMKGISDNENDISAQALIAGNDMLLVPRNLKRELSGVLAAVKDGRLKESDIDAKCRKVLTLKYRMGLNKRPIIDESGISNRLNTPDVEKLQRELNRAAVTVVKDSVGVLPFDLSVSDNILLSISPSMSTAYSFYHRLSQSVELAWLHANVDSLVNIYERIRPAQQVIVAIHQKNCKAYVSLLEKIASEKPLVLVCFTSQDVLSSLGNLPKLASSVVLAHTDTKVLQQQVADMLVGKRLVDGRLSVDIDSVWKSGTGVVLDPNSPRSYCPENFGMDSSILARIDTIVSNGIANKAFPGCHVLVLKEGYPVYNKCFGYFTYENRQKVRENDLYDLASVSKVAGTLLAVMKLYDEGKFGLTDAIGKYVPEMRGSGKENITIRELLFHESGLPAYLPFYEEAIDMKSCKGGLYKKHRDEFHDIPIGVDRFVSNSFSYKKEWVSTQRSEVYSLPLADGLYLNGAFRGEILKQIAAAPLKGHSYVYSCLNFMLLKEMTERISGVSMDVYLDSVFYKPMGLNCTMYNPLNRVNRNCVVPTLSYDFLRKGVLQGYVNDEAAAFMGGVSGNAGLFSTAQNVGKIFQMLLDKGVCGNHRYLSRATCKLFMEMKAKGSRRGLGFDRPDTKNVESSPCTPEAPAAVFGHMGYTGTCVWADPENELVFVFLSNRTYPTAFNHKQLTKMNIRPLIQQAIYQSISK